MVAEVTGIPWASYVLAPLSFFSAFDPPVLPPYPRLARADKLSGHGTRDQTARRASPAANGPSPSTICAASLDSPRGSNPLFDAKHSPNLVLALFSRVLGVEQKDWPANTLITGFCFYDADAAMPALPPHLEEFLAAGAASRRLHAGLRRRAGCRAVSTSIRRKAADAARDSRRAARSDLTRATGRSNPLPDSICVAEYAPYSALFSRASLVVHQGGVGTTAQCLRAGKPMLIMPYSHDQPDNARRMRRLGVSRTIQKAAYTPARASAAIRSMLDNPGYREQTLQVAEQLNREDGVATACNALEDLERKIDSTRR